MKWMLVLLVALFASCRMELKSPPPVYISCNEAKVQEAWDSCLTKIPPDDSLNFAYNAKRCLEFSKELHCTTAQGSTSWKP